MYTHTQVLTRRRPYVHTHKHLLHNTQGIVEFASRDDQEEAIAKLDDKEFKNNFDGSRTYLRVL